MMKQISVIVFILVSFLYTATAFADEPEKKEKTDAMLFGDVKSEKEHIPFATIRVKGTTIGTAADATGHFKMTNLPVGKQIVVVSAVGYVPKEVEVELEANKSTTILVQLKPDVIGLEQVVVSADRNSRSRNEAPVIVNSINAQLMKRTQNVTLSDGLNFAPGLRMENNCQNCGFSQVRMNGLEGPYTQILVNSRPIFSGLAGVYGLELIPANMIERVEIIRGGGSSMYGSNAVAGTINLITKDPIANQYSASGTYALTGAGTGGEAAGDYNLNLNGSFVSSDYHTGMSLFAFTRKRNPYDANNDEFSEIALINNSTFGTRIYQRIAERGKLTLDYFNINEFRRGGNDFDLPLHEADIAESVRHQINTGALTFDLLLRESDKFTAFFSAQKVGRDSYYGANHDPSAYGNTADFTFSSGLQYSASFKNLLFAPAILTNGIEYNGSYLEDMKLGYYDRKEDVHLGNTLVADQKLETQAGFIQSEWNLNPIMLTAGLRFDHYIVADLTGESNDVKGNVLSPRLSLLYTLSHHIRFRAGYAKGFRAPQIFDEDLHIETSGSRKVLHRNDVNLKQETSNSYTISADFQNDRGRWQYQVLIEGFYTQLDNPFASEYGTPDEEGVVIYTRYNAEAGAVVKGVNLEINASPSARFQLQSGFTLQKSLFEEPQEFGSREFFRSPDQYGYVSLNYSPGMRWNISATGNYTGPMLVPYFGPRLADPEEGQLNTTPSFFDAGLKMTYDMKISESSKIQFSGGIKNLFNSYQDDFDSGINRDPSYIYGPLNPRTIYVGLSLGNLL